MMKWLLIAALVVASGCSKKDGKAKTAPAAEPAGSPAAGSPAGSTVDPSLAELAALKDKMCACKDKACVDAVNPEVDAFFKRSRASFDSMAPDKKEQSAKLEDEEYQCWKKLK